MQYKQAKKNSQYLLLSLLLDLEDLRKGMRNSKIFRGFSALNKMIKIGAHFRQPKEPNHSRDQSEFNLGPPLWNIK